MKNPLLEILSQAIESANNDIPNILKAEGAEILAIPITALFLQIQITCTAHVERTKLEIPQALALQYAYQTHDEETRDNPGNRVARAYLRSIAKEANVELAFDIHIINYELDMTRLLEAVDETAKKIEEIKETEVQAFGQTTGENIVDSRSIVMHKAIIARNFLTLGNLAGALKQYSDEFRGECGDDNEALSKRLTLRFIYNIAKELGVGKELEPKGNGRVTLQ